MLATLGAAAFVASLTMKWQSAVIPLDFGAGQDGAQSLTYSYSNNVTTPDMLGLVYALGAVALLTLAGAVITRSEQALRLRFGASGLAVGVLAVVVSMTLALPDSLYFEFGRFGIPPGLDIAVSYEPGVFCAYGAVLFPAVAIWLAARPAVRDAQAAAEAAAQATGAPDGFPAGYATPRRPDAVPAPRAQAWSAEHVEPFDLTVTPER